MSFDETHSSFSSEQSNFSEDSQTQTETISNQITSYKSPKQMKNTTNPIIYKFNRLFSMKFSICPDTLSHPSYREDVLFHNEKGNNEYISDRKNFYFLPYSNSLFTSYDGDNSSLRLIRPSLHALPSDYYFYKKTSLKLGFNIEPFANIGKSNENVVNSYQKTKIVQCEKCKSFFNEQFTSSIEEDHYYYSKYKYQCGICGYKGNFYSIRESEDSNLKLDNIIGQKEPQSIPTKINKTIEYIFNNENEEQIIDYNILMIDISEEAKRNFFSQYILDSIKQIAMIIKQKEKTNLQYAICLFNHEKIFFYSKSRNCIKMHIMPDMNNPFCPIREKDFFMDLNGILDILDKIILDPVESSTYYINQDKGSCINSCIYAAVDYAKHNYGNNKYFNVLIFSCNRISNGIMFFAEIDCQTNKEINKNNGSTLYTPQHHFITNLNKVFLANHLSFTFFITGREKNQIHLANYLSYNLYYYNIDFKDQKDIYHKFQKIFYDMSKILSSNNIIYDVKYELTFHPHKFSAYLLTYYKGKNNIKLSCIKNPEELSLLYEITQNKKLETRDTPNFQFSISYLSPKDKKRHLRILNWSFPISSDCNEVYNSIDIDCLTRLLLCSEISKLKNNDLLLAKESITKILINIFYVYKSEIYAGNPLDELVSPFSLKYLSLYIFCFFNNYHIQNLFNNFAFGKSHHNNITYLLYSLFSHPLEKVIKKIYPTFINLARENTIEQLGLSLFYLRLNMILLVNDGEYSTIYVFKYANPESIKKIFHNQNFEELKTLSHSEIEVEFEFNEALQKYIDGIPTKIMFGENENFPECDGLMQLLVEDCYYYLNGKKFCDYVKEINDNVVVKLIENL